MFKREPSIVIATIGTLLTLLATFQLDFLSTDQATIIVVVLNAGLAAWNAVKVRPFQPAVFTYLIASIATLCASYGLDFSQEQVGAVNGLVLSVLALLLRVNVTPEVKP